MSGNNPLGGLDLDKVGRRRTDVGDLGDLISREDLVDNSKTDDDELQNSNEVQAKLTFDFRAVKVSVAP